MILEKTTAVYYDGLSSKPQEIEVFLDKTKSCFQFTNNEHKIIKWPISEVVYHKSGLNLIIKPKENVEQSVFIKDAAFIKIISGFRNLKNNYTTHEKLFKLGFKTHLVIAAALMVFIALAYVFIIPWVGEKSVVFVPEEYDNYLGNLFFEQSKILEDIDNQKTKSLNLFASELKLNNTKKLKFTVINSPIVNAFALPDGNIVVYTGILNSMQNYNELAGLIGHEASHVNNRHSTKMMCRNLSGYIFISAILGDANGVMATIADNANTLQSLSFSREFEQQADLDGFNMLVSNKINPKGMVNLFKRLQTEEAGFAIPEFLSSHPITKERIIFIDKKIKNQQLEFTENTKLKQLFIQLKQ